MVIQDKLYQTGIWQRRHMFGVAGAEDQVENTTDLNDKLQDFVTRYCFGDIWQRPGLSIIDRSKITFAMLVATGKTHEMRVHARGALENGVSAVELREIAVHSVLYCGIPCGNDGIRVLEEVFAERNIDPDLDGESAKVRGLRAGSAPE